MRSRRKNPVRTALAKRRLLHGAFQVLRDRAVTEIVLGAGFDFLLVDTEHRPFNPETIEDLVRTAQGQGSDKGVVVRVPRPSRGALQYAMESGADGVLVPLVNSRRQAEEIVSLTRYPPKGTRGLNTSTRASDWGQKDAAAYTRKANRELLVAVQIETESGLEAVDEIAQVEGIDLLFVGPMDLSHSLGRTGQLSHKKVRAAIARIFQSGRQHGKWLGVLAPDVPFAKWCVAQGVQFLVYRSDLRFLKAAAEQDFRAVTSLRRRR